MRILTENLWKTVKNIKPKLHKLPVLNYIYMSMDNGLLEFFNTDLETVQYSQTKSVKSYGDFAICVPGAVHQTKKMVNKVYSGSIWVDCDITNHPFIDFCRIAKQDFRLVEFEPAEKYGMYQILVAKLFDGTNEKPVSITKFHCLSAEDFPIHNCRKFLKEN